MIATIIVGLVVAGAIALAVRSTINSRKKGGCGCGCSGCGQQDKCGTKQE